MARLMHRPAAMTPPRFNAIAIALHWVVAAALVGQFALGWWMTSLPESPVAPRAPWVDLHRSFGVTIGALVLARLAWRLSRIPPAQYATVPHAVGFVAELSHSVVYAFLVVVPLSGLLSTLFGRDPIRFFGVALGSGPGNEALQSLFGGLHLVSVWILTALIVLHVSAALWHLVRRDGAFWRIFPRALP